MDENITNRDNMAQKTTVKFTGLQDETITIKVEPAQANDLYQRMEWTGNRSKALGLWLQTLTKSQRRRIATEVGNIHRVTTEQPAGSWLL